MKKLLVVSLTAIAFAASPVWAKVANAERAITGFLSPAGGCMTENAQVSINFNGVETDVATIKSKFDAKVAEIEKTFKAAELTTYEIQSMNYNISPQNYGNGMSSTYQFSGSISFMVSPGDKATGVMADLTKKGYQASVNVSSYRNSGVPCQNKN